MSELPRDQRAVTEEAFLRAADLDRPELAAVRKAVLQGDMPAARAALVRHFQERTEPRWFFDLRAEQRGTIRPAWGAPSAGCVARADMARRNRFEVKPGTILDFGPDLAWRTAEMQGLGSSPSNFKRMVFMRDLAAAHALTNESAYVAKLAELIERWVRDWPLVVDPEFGPASALLARADGHKAMPTAYRVITWLDVLYSGALFAPAMPVDTAFRLLKSLWFTALQYRRYETSRYTPANHHLWERGAAPFAFGVLLPEFPEVARLASQAMPVIRQHAERSFLPDGSYEERSTPYSYAALSMFLLPLYLAQVNGIRLLDDTHIARLRRATEIMARITLPNGEFPDIGDDTLTAWHTARLLGRGAHMLGSRLCADVMARLELDVLPGVGDGWGEGPEDGVLAAESVVPGLPATSAASPSEGDGGPATPGGGLPLVVHVRASGYFVARDGWTPRASAVSLTVPVPGLPNHAHDDALSLQLVVRGVRLVGTPASELYVTIMRDEYTGHALKGYFRSMVSHNVVLVGGAPLRTIAALAAGERIDPTPVTTEWKATEEGMQVRATHQGYPGTQLTREVNFRHGRGWVVRDRVQAGGPSAPAAPHVARWHFEYGVEVIPVDAGFVAARDGVLLRIGVASEQLRDARLYRDTRWLGESPVRPGEPAPWVLDVAFGGPSQGTDQSSSDGHAGAELETRFEIR